MADWSSLLGAMNGAVLNAFGREVVYLPEGGQQFTLRAVFEATREPEENAPGIYAVLFVRLVDIPVTPGRGDEVIVEGATYKVFDVVADHSGGAVLRLRQA
ncbi:MAG: hypothetical protein KJZ78_21020 [Bryobacteraceae bacterium]|nr:hypothetical protein [Bryobacteraceae bacterium]